MKWIIFSLLLTISEVAFSQESYIQVISEPNVNVYIDNIHVGITNLNDDGLIIENVKPGIRVIKLTKEGFNSQQESISIKPGEVLTYKVKPFIPEISIAQSGNTENQKIEKSIGKIKIQSLPISIRIVIPALGVDSYKTKDLWEAKDIPIGKYLSKFIWKDKELIDTIIVDNKTTTHLMVKMTTGVIEIVKTLNNTKEHKRTNEIRSQRISEKKGNSKILLYRKASKWSSVTKVKVYIDDKFIGKLSNKGCMQIYQVPDGMHTLSFEYYNLGIHAKGYIFTVDNSIQYFEYIQTGDIYYGAQVVDSSRGKIYFDRYSKKLINVNYPY